MRLSFDQKRILAESLSNIGVVWFGGGVVAPVFGAKSLLEIILPGVWGLTLAVISISLSLFILKKK